MIASIREMIWGKFEFKEIPILKFENEFIVCNRRYPFKHSTIKRYSKIHFSEINEVMLNSFQASFVINNTEVIFLPLSDKEELQKFVEQNGVPVSNRVDNWEKILEQYMEDEFSDEHKKETIQILSEQGIDEIELKSIRKKISWFMAFSFSMEWLYIGQYDFLEWKTSKKNYWWSMEIALRNFKRK